MEDSYPVTASLLSYTVEHDLNKLKLTEDEEEILDFEDPGAEKVEE